MELTAFIMQTKARMQSKSMLLVNGLLAGVHVGTHVSHLERSLDSQSPPEGISPHCEIEAFRCGVQPCATPWQPEPRIRNDPGLLLAIVATLRHNS